MRKLLLAGVAALSLAGCASLQTVYDTVTGVSIPMPSVFVALNSFDAAEVTATQYLRYCKGHRADSACAPSALAGTVKAVRAGRVARNSLEGYIQQNPNAQVGPSALYNALIGAVTSINTTVPKGAQ